MVKDIGTRLISTDRLILRRFEEDDVESVFENWASDREVTRFLNIKENISLEETRYIILDWIGKYENKDFYQWCIQLKDEKSLGSIGSIYVDREKAVEVGYCLAKKYWNMGYITEALEAVLEYMFERVGVENIIAKHHVENKPSGRVMEKVGMKKDGEFSEYMKKLGSYKAYIYSISKDKWKLNRS